MGRADYPVRRVLRIDLWPRGCAVLRFVPAAGSLHRNLLCLSILRNLRERSDADHRHGAVAGLWTERRLGDRVILRICRKRKRSVSLVDRLSGAAAFAGSARSRTNDRLTV